MPDPAPSHNSIVAGGGTKRSKFRNQRHLGVFFCLLGAVLVGPLVDWLGSYGFLLCLPLWIGGGGLYFYAFFTDTDRWKYLE